MTTTEDNGVNVAYGSNEYGWRVKLYELEKSGAWIDKGTGYVIAVPAQDPSHPSDGPCMYVTNEVTQEILLKSKIRMEDVYEKQGENIIMWRDIDPSGQTDYALSFQESEGCATIWDSIGEIQGHYIQYRDFDNTNYRGNHHLSQGYLATGYIDKIDENHFMVLPPLDKLSIESLPSINEQLLSFHPSQRDFISYNLLDNDGKYIRLFLDMFVQLEEKNDILNLNRMADIFRGIILINDPNIIEFALSDEMFVKFAGVFEYDVTLRVKADYRYFLSSVVQFKEVFPLPSEEIRFKCKFLFRLKYLRDFMIHPTIDEPGITAVNSMISFATNEICAYMFQNKDYIDEILQYMLLYLQEDDAKEIYGPAPPKPTYEKFIEGLRFLRELFFMSKTIAFEKRYELYHSLYQNLSNPFFKVIILILKKYVTKNNIHTINNNSDDNSSKIRIGIMNEENKFCVALVAEIMAIFAIVCPSLLRQVVLEGPHPLNHPFSKGYNQSQNDNNSIIISKSINNDENNNKNDNNNNSLLFLVINIVFTHDMKLNNDNNNDENNTNNNDNDKSNHHEGKNYLAAIIEHLGDSLKSLLDAQRFEKEERDKFINIFYENYIGWLFTPFIHDQIITNQELNVIANPSNYVIFNPYFTSSRRVFFEILILCVSSHQYRLKYFMMKNSIIGKIITKCFQSDLTWMHLYAVKFLKAILTVKDDYYVRYIIKLDLFRAMFDNYSTIKKKDNLVSSIIYDLLDYIRAESIKALVIYIVEKYSNGLSQMKGFVDLHEKLRIKYDQYIHATSEPQFVTLNSDGTSVANSNGNDVLGNFQGRIRASSATSTIQNRKQQEIESEDDYFFSEDSDNNSEDYSNSNVSSKDIDSNSIKDPYHEMIREQSEKFGFGFAIGSDESYLNNSNNNDLCRASPKRKFSFESNNNKNGSDKITTGLSAEQLINNILTIDRSALPNHNINNNINNNNKNNYFDSKVANRVNNNGNNNEGIDSINSNQPPKRAVHTLFAMLHEYSDDVEDNQKNSSSNNSNNNDNIDRESIYIDSLPPLRSKFRVDEDDDDVDITKVIFNRNHSNTSTPNNNNNNNNISTIPSSSIAFKIKNGHNNITNKNNNRLGVNIILSQNRTAANNNIDNKPTPTPLVSFGIYDDLVDVGPNVHTNRSFNILGNDANNDIISVTEICTSAAVMTAATSSHYNNISNNINNNNNNIDNNNDNIHNEDSLSVVDNANNDSIVKKAVRFE
eukprot:gene8950-12067_t